jgi:hypothetical protein
MINIQQRLFWLLVLLAQASIIVLPFTSFYSSLGISGPHFFTFIFQVAFGIPLVLMTSQKSSYDTISGRVSLGHLWHL